MNFSFPLGEGVDRVEDEGLVRGSARYIADLSAGQQVLHASFVRSSVPAARITRVDTAAAAAGHGVVTVLTGADLEPHVRPMGLVSAPEPRFAELLNVVHHSPRQRCLALDRVRYVGEPVAVVVATDRYLAEDAATRVVVDYETDEPVLDMESAVRPSSPLVHESLESNAGARLSYRTGDTEAHHASEDVVVVEGTYRVGRQTGLSIEGRGVLAQPVDAGRLDVWTSSQAPFVVWRVICEATGWNPDLVRVRTPEVGGGFGPKVPAYPEEVVVPYLAHLLGRAVTWIEDRYENLVSSAHARDQVHHTRLTVDRGGRILAWEDDFLVDLGAHNQWMVGVVANTALHLLGPYRVPAARICGTGVFTNKTPTSQYRGAGRPEATFALERSLDRAARELGITGSELRARNILRGEDLPYDHGIPYRDGLDMVYDGGDYAEVLDRALALVPTAELAELREGTDPEKRLGFGLAAYVEATARGPNEPETARVALRPDGIFRVHTGSSPSGQSHRTIFAQIVAEATGCDLADVEVVTGDTDGVPQGLGSFASRTAVIAGSAARLATARLVAEAKDLIQEVTGVYPERHDRTGFILPGREPITWRTVASWFAASGPLASRPALEAVETFAPETVTWTMGVHVVVVQVDPGTGSVEVLRYAVAHEGGPALNPRVVDGQLKGGVAQGIGGALLEEVRYDRGGQPITVTLAEYLVPGAGDVPPVRLKHLEVPSKLNPLETRGVGESGVIGSAAAIASAVDDALQDTGLHVATTPMTPDRLLAWLEECRR